MRDVDERRPSLSAAAPSSAVCFAPLYYLDPATGRMVFVPPAGRGTTDAALTALDLRQRSVLPPRRLQNLCRQRRRSRQLPCMLL